MTAAPSDPTPRNTTMSDRLIRWAATFEMRDPWHRDIVLGMLTDTRRDLTEWAESVAHAYSKSGTLEVTAVILALLDEIETLRATTEGADDD